MKKLLMFVAIFFLAACAARPPRVSEGDPGVTKTMATVKSFELRDTREKSGVVSVGADAGVALASTAPGLLVATAINLLDANARSRRYMELTFVVDGEERVTTVRLREDSRLNARPGDRIAILYSANEKATTLVNVTWNEQNKQ